jgi:polar amino acid transport system substrate-binding protein
VRGIEADPSAAGGGKAGQRPAAARAAGFGGGREAAGGEGFPSPAPILVKAAAALIGAVAVFFLSAPAGAIDAWERTATSGELKWGADAAGGAPYVFRDDQRPDRLVGFEVELMEALAARLGLRSTPVIVPWDELVPALLRGDFDLAFNGIEITEERRQKIDFTRPYYVFAEQITARRGDLRFSSLESLRGHRVGTLSSSFAQRLMEQDGRIDVVAYPTPVEPYKDLEIGRLDAVLQDVPIAAWYAGPNPKLENVGAPVGEGLYAGAVRRDSPEYRKRIDAALAAVLTDGTAEKIYRKWALWTPAQKTLATWDGDGPTAPGRKSLRNYLGLIFRGAGVTLALSLASMVLAVVAGFVLCLGRLYGGPWLKSLCVAYLEITRGTPLLIQLYVLYYGLPNLGIHLNAFVAAVLGVGFNYAAYESEIYRAGILSVPKGQEEAARSLGLSLPQTLRRVVLPQALRTILPPSTNDFIALFKDTSLVSIITVTELTRAYGQAATATYRFLELGLLTAALYLAMSLPLSYLSRRLERKRRVVH